MKSVPPRKQTDQIVNHELSPLTNMLTGSLHKESSSELATVLRSPANRNITANEAKLRTLTNIQYPPSLIVNVRHS